MAMPEIDQNRELSLDEDTIEKCRYLLVYKGKENLGQIIDEALKAFLVVQFEKLGIEHFIDEAYEARVEANKIRQEQEAKKYYEAKLLLRAKQSIIEKEIALIREQDLIKQNIIR